MLNTSFPSAKGLEGVIAGDSSICLIDGEAGELFYRGYNIKTLAQNSSFEEVSYLLLKGNLPKQRELDDFREQLDKSCYIPSQVLAMIALTPSSTHPMDMLRSIVSALSQHELEQDLRDNSPESNFKKATHLIAQIPVIIAAFHRLRNGLQPIPPLQRLNLAGNFLYMLTGKEPDLQRIKTFDTCLILHADHSFNASTFTARVTAATLSDLHSGITAAIGCLKGPLHGGANQKVMEMLSKIGEHEEVESYIRKMLEEGKKVPGFGHRVYKTEDPRGTSLREVSKNLAQLGGNAKWFEISELVERTVSKVLKEKNKSNLYVNVDFYSASTYTQLGIPTDLFTVIFAMSRTVGWCAHIKEQHENNRLIRPRANYTGEKNLIFLPIKQR